MKRGWIAILKDGVEFKECDYEWREVPKKAIKTLSLIYDDRRWDLTDKEAYFVKTRASMIPGIKQSFKIERRTIGFYEGANKVCYHVDEATGKFSMEVIDNSGR